MLLNKLFQNGNCSRNRASTLVSDPGRTSLRRSRSAPRFESLENRAMLTTFTVTSLDDAGAGTLRDAIESANMTPGADVIDFAPGVKGTITLDSELSITDDVDINGPGRGKLTVSGGGANRVFNISNTGGDVSEVAINHLTISDGFVTGVFNSGAGIRNGGELSLDHVRMNNNQAIDTPFGGGAAIFNIFGTLNVSHSSFDANRATNTTTNASPVAGGAIANVLGSADISYSRFTNNEVDSGVSIGLGGAISATFGGTLDVSHSYFRGNSVSSDTEALGGAIGTGFEANPTGGLAVNVTVAHSLLMNNSADGASGRGGAIWADVSSFALDHSLLSFNRVDADSAHGGGIYNAEGSNFTLTHALVFANRATTDGGEAIGGGVYNAGTMFSDRAKIFLNKASTSHDNVFGDLEQLDDVLAA